MFSNGDNVKLTNTTHINITLPPTLQDIQEELSLEPNDSSIAAEFSTHVPTAGELSSSVTIPYQARDHNNSSTVELQVGGERGCGFGVRQGVWFRVGWALHRAFWRELSSSVTILKIGVAWGWG